MKQNQYGYIYFTKNLINDKKYIGQHKGSFTKKYLGSGKLLTRAIKKYGKENFEVTLWEWCDSLDKLNEQEKYYIKRYNAVKDSSYYNLSMGGSGLPTGSCLKGKTYEEIHGVEKAIILKKLRSETFKGERSQESRSLMSLAKLGKKRESFSEQHKINIGNANRGRKHSDEYRKNCSDRIMGNKRTEKTRIKISNSTKGILKGKQPKVICPYCNKKGGQGGMNRYHFDNCKYK